MRCAARDGTAAGVAGSADAPAGDAGRPHRAVRRDRAPALASAGRERRRDFRQRRPRAAAAPCRRPGRSLAGRHHLGAPPSCPGRPTRRCGRLPCATGDVGSGRGGGCRRLRDAPTPERRDVDHRRHPHPDRRGRRSGPARPDAEPVGGVARASHPGRIPSNRRDVGARNHCRRRGGRRVGAHRQPVQRAPVRGTATLPGGCPRRGIAAGGVAGALGPHGAARGSPGSSTASSSPSSAARHWQTSCAPRPRTRGTPASSN